MVTPWKIELFGGLRARRDDLILTHFETRKAAALLAFLAFYGDRAHHRDALAEQIWPDEDVEATRNRFRQALASIRRVLETPETLAGSVVIADRAEASLGPDAFTTDVAAFETALKTAARLIAPEECVQTLHKAVLLYRGELLPGYYEAWIAPERRRLASAYRDALSSLADALHMTGDLPGAIEMAHRAVLADPLREDAHGILMRLYAEAGRLPEALRQYHELERLLQTELGVAPSPATRTLLEQLRCDPIAKPQVTPPPLQTGYGRKDTMLEPEGGAVPLDSKFYIVRPTDEAFEAAVVRMDSIVLVKGARQMGKTSLLARGLQQARQASAKVVFTDLQKLTALQMESADALFFAIAEMMAEQLQLDLALETVWNQRRSWNVNFERFLRLEVLNKIEAPIVWGIDEVDRLFGHPFSAEVFGLFRSWHNERSLDPTGPWKRLTLVIAYATEAHLFITDLNQSPFNVGTRLTLEDFTQGEVAELNRRYHSPLRNAQEIARYYALVGGNPYLLRRGLHALAEDLDFPTFEALADSEDGCFGDHLRRMLGSLRLDSELCEAVCAILRGASCPSSESFYRLRSAGIVVGKSAADARMRCRVYQTYLEQHLL